MVDTACDNSHKESVFSTTFLQSLHIGIAINLIATLSSHFPSSPTPAKPLDRNLLME